MNFLGSLLAEKIAQAGFMSKNTLCGGLGNGAAGICREKCGCFLPTRSILFMQQNKVQRQFGSIIKSESVLLELHESCQVSRKRFDRKEQS
jgi:hypothetical protein